MRLLIALFAVAMMSFAIGCTPTEEKKDTPPAKTETGAVTPSSDASSTTASVTPDTSNMQEVSLKLPGMT